MSLLKVSSGRFFFSLICCRVKLSGVKQAFIPCARPLPQSSLLWLSTRCFLSCKHEIAYRCCNTHIVLSQHKKTRQIIHGHDIFYAWWVGGWVCGLYVFIQPYFDLKENELAASLIKAYEKCPTDVYLSESQKKLRNRNWNIQQHNSGQQPKVYKINSEF